MVPQTRPLQLRPSPMRAARSHDAAAAGETEHHTAETTSATPVEPDIAGTIADEVARRTELVMLTQRKEIDASELAMDRMRAHFDEREQERAELLREWNVMRDMAMEQMKRDNEIMKKWITLI